MFQFVKLFVFILMALGRTEFAAQDGLTFEQRSSLPDWAQQFGDSGLDPQHSLIAHINPFYQRGDFDGDGKLDLAVFVKQRTSGKLGIAFIHQATKRIYVVGAGKPIPGHYPEDDDLKWIDAWRVFDRGKVEQGAGETPPPRLRGDALTIMKTESASALLWWNGTEYRWYQQGD